MIVHRNGWKHFLIILVLTLFTCLFLLTGCANKCEFDTVVEPKLDRGQEVIIKLTGAKGVVIGNRDGWGSDCDRLYRIRFEDNTSNYLYDFELEIKEL